VIRDLVMAFKALLTAAFATGAAAHAVVPEVDLLRCVCFSPHDPLTLTQKWGLVKPATHTTSLHHCLTYTSCYRYRYLGRWYQVYADLETSLFESKYCVVADYGVFANNTISVRNRQRDGSVSGAYNGILGWAALNNRTGLGTADGSLSVYLQIPPPGPQGIAAPYDIILLGPASYGPFGLYEYAVVSDPLEISLFVLVRDVDTYYAKYNKTVMETLRADGFINPINEPRQTVQTGCAP